MTWTTSTIGEICDAGEGEVKTGPFGSQLHQSDYEDDGIPVVMPKDIVDGGISESSIARVGQGHVDRLSQHKLSVGDIVYGRRGDIGRQALVKPKNAGWLCGTGCLRITLGNGPLLPEFLHLYLRQNDVIEWIAKQAVGATMPNLNTSILRSIPVRYPSDTREQQDIVDTITAYDNLIENNNRRIAILEEMAQSLYREWFVKFRFPGHENTQFIDSPLGKIPEGWEVMAASEAIQINPRTKLPKEGEKPFVPMSGLNESLMVIGDIELKAGNSGAKFVNSDTLFSRITPCLQNGKIGYVQFLDEEQPVGFGSTEFIVLRATEHVCPEYVYLVSRTSEFRENAIKSMTGATGRQRVSNSCFDSYMFAVPEKGTMERFHDVVKGMFDEIFNLSKRNKNLRAQRDLLLPRLMGGKINIPE